MDLETARRQVGPVRDRIVKSIVQQRWGYAEDEKLMESVKALAEYIGERGWEDGFSGITDEHILREEANYGKIIGTGIEATAERKETMRQWCYQFVQLAERVIEENNELRRKLKEIGTFALALSPSLPKDDED